MGLSEWLAVVSGIAIAAACGLRAFLPLLALGIAARVGVVRLVDAAAWLGTDLALIALGVATLLELAGDKIPVVDHALDVAGLAVRPAAAWFAAYALLGTWPAPWGQGLALGLGLLALAIQGMKAKLRLGSTTVTLGAGNPVLSVFEDLASLALTLSALIVPVAALALIALLAVVARPRRARPA